MEMIKKDWISVIIPTYNRTIQLARAVESCFKQDYDKVEVIVIDDGSTDDTSSVAKGLEQKWGKERFRYMQQQHQGACVARNLGIDLAQGEYIQFLDSDDIILPEKFTQQLAALQTGQYPIAICDFIYINENDESILEKELNTGDLRSKLLRFHGIAIHTPLLRADSIPHFLRFRPELERGQDVDFFLRYFLGVQGWIYTPGFWAVYMCHTGERVSDTYHHGRQFEILYWSLCDYWKKLENHSKKCEYNKWILRQYALNIMSAFHEAGNFRMARLYGAKASLPPFSRNRLYGVVSELATQLLPHVLQDAIRKWKIRKNKVTIKSDIA